MTDTNVFQLSQPGTFADPLTEVLRTGARALLAQAVEAEVAALLSCHADKLTDDGRQRPDRCALPARARPCRRRLGTHSLLIGDLAALRAPLEEPRSADPGSLPQ